MVTRTTLALLLALTFATLAEAQVIHRTAVRDGKMVLSAKIKPPLGHENRIWFEGSKTTLGVCGKDGLAFAASMSNDGEGTIITVEEVDEDGESRREVARHVAVRRSNVHERVNLVIWPSRDKHDYFVTFEAKGGKGGSVLIKSARTASSPVRQDELPLTNE